LPSNIGLTVLQNSRNLVVASRLQGGDLRAALSSDVSGDLRWYNRGQHIALDVARGLHYLHSHDVRRGISQLCHALLTCVSNMRLPQRMRILASAPALM